MAQALEAGMLLCFGISWPMSLIKNIKAHSAKNISLGFIALIIIGYISGITAKIVSGNYSYVLAVYVLNLLIVSMNLVVYFVNLRHDHEEEQEKEVAESAVIEQYRASAPLTAEQSRRVAEFSEQNREAESGAAVFFGSGRFDSAEIGELGYELDKPLYNRSISGLTISQSGSALNACVSELDPSQVFIAIGQEDVEKSGFNLNQFVNSYRWLLHELHHTSKARLYVMSVVSESPNASAANQALAEICRESGCTYLDVTGMLTSRDPARSLMEVLRLNTRTHSIRFCDAMKLGAN